MERTFNSDKVNMASHLLSEWYYHKLLTVGFSVHIKNHAKASLTGYGYSANAGSLNWIYLVSS